MVERITDHLGIRYERPVSIHVGPPRPELHRIVMDEHANRIATLEPLGGRLSLGPCTVRYTTNLGGVVEKTIESLDDAKEHLAANAWAPAIVSADLTDFTHPATKVMVKRFSTRDHLCQLGLVSCWGSSENGQVTAVYLGAKGIETEIFTGQMAQAIDLATGLILLSAQLPD